MMSLHGCKTTMVSATVKYLQMLETISKNKQFKINRINLTNNMGHKKVCLECRKAFSIYNNGAEEVKLTCPQCGVKVVLMPHRFRPPKKEDIKQWSLIRFLIENGFLYQHVYENHQYVKYPSSMDEAKEFVTKFKSQAVPIKE